MCTMNIESELAVIVFNDNLKNICFFNANVQA